MRVSWFPLKSYILRSKKTIYFNINFYVIKPPICYYYGVIPITPHRKLVRKFVDKSCVWPAGAVNIKTPWDAVPPEACSNFMRYIIFWPISENPESAPVAIIIIVICDRILKYVLNVFLHKYVYTMKPFTRYITSICESLVKGRCLKIMTIG